MTDLVKRLRKEAGITLDCYQTLDAVDPRDILSVLDEIERMQDLLMKACDPDRINIHFINPPDNKARAMVIKDMRAWCKKNDWRSDSFDEMLDAYAKDRNID